MSKLAATGNEVLWALGSEPHYNVPGGALTAYDPILPVSAGMVPSESASTAVNRAGYVRAGVPGPKGGTVEWSLPLTVAQLPEYLEHLIGDAVRDDPEAGVVRLTFEPPNLSDFADTSFWALFGKLPVRKELVYGIKFGALEMTIGDNAMIPVKVSGEASQGTQLSPPEAQPGNLGVYSLGPHVRGPLDRSTGDVWIQVSRDVASGGLRFKAWHGEGDVPNFVASPEVDVLVDLDGRGAWQNLQDQAGADLGIWAENVDRLEVIFPGTSVDHGDLAIGDTFRFRRKNSWATPALSTIAAAQAFTSAHWTVKVRPAGSAAAYREELVDSGVLKIEAPIQPRRGNASRYVHQILRPGPFTPGLTFKRAFVDDFFGDLLERHERLDVVTSFAGRQLGGGALREGIEWRMPSAGLAKADAPISGADTVTEDVELVGETDDAGNPPLSVVLVTERDWTPSA